MIARQILILAAVCAAAAAQPGLLKQGSAAGSGGWKLTYSAVAKPPFAPGERIAIPNDATHTDVPGAGPVFHRFFADPSSRTYFGYDVVVSPGKGRASTVKFRPLSLHGDQLPKEYGAAQFHAAAIAEFPSEIYQTGETIAVDVLKNPSTGQRVVDYVQVTFAAQTAAANATTVAAGFPKTSGNPSAPVCIELFSDFECPSCKAFHDGLLPVIVRDYIASGKAYLVSHEFPLTQHPYAREAANYATAAARLGKYQLVADALFRDQQAWTSSGKLWDTVAGVLNAAEQKDVLEWSKDPAVAAQVQRDVDTAISQGINRTPTIVISRGGKRYPFPGPDPANYQIMKSLIDELLK